MLLRLENLILMLLSYGIQAINDKSSSSLIPTLPVLTYLIFFSEQKLVLHSFVEFLWLYEKGYPINSLLAKRQRRS